MSDSEDEGAFASADEGQEVTKSKKGQAKAQQPTADTKNPKDKPVNRDKGPSTATGAKSGGTKSKPSKTEAKKDKEREQQKKKGKGNNQQQSSKPENQTKSSSAKDIVKKSPDATKHPEPPSVEHVQERSTDTSTDTGQKHISSAAAPSESATQSESVPVEVGSGDAKEKDMSKKAGDVRKGIPSNETSPESQTISREGPIFEGDGSFVQEETKSDSDGWGWSGWGTSLLTAASTSVQTFKSQVGEGFNTIMETVESSLGAIDPEDIAREESKRKAEAEKAATVTSQPSEPLEEEGASEASNKSEKEPEEIKTPQEKEKSKQEKNPASDSGGGGGWFSGWGVAEIAKKVQDTGKSIASKGHTLMSDGFDAVENLASGGIDVLENIGKKTYNTLSEHDPAFKKTREYLNRKGKTNKPNLSSILREAKEESEREAAATKENEEARKAHFGTQFDEFQGIAHLEALEMLSNQSEKKVHSLLNSLSSEDLKVIKPILISIKEAFEVDEDGDEADDQKEQDFSGLVSQYVSELELGTAPDKLNKVHAMVKQWMVDFDTQESHEGETVKSIHQRAIQSLAELTSKGVEQFHKAGELVLMQRDADKDCKERAHSFARLTGVLCHEIGNLATKFSDCLNKIAAQQEDAEDVKTMVTNIYLEATNSSTYIQDAFQLLLPVLQQAAIEHNILSRQS